MGRLGDREEDGAGEFYGEKDRKKRAGKRTGKEEPEKTDRKRRTGKGGPAEQFGRNVQSGETLNREKYSVGRNAQEKRFRKSTAAENSVLSRKRAAP